MKKLFIFFLIYFFSCHCFAQMQTHADTLAKKRIMLPNGWSLTPAGRSLPVGDLPLNIAVSSSKKYLAVTCNGQSTQALYLIDSKKEKILDTIVVAKSWLGLKFSDDEKFLYA